jgi:hypothetical protein
MGEAEKPSWWGPPSPGILCLWNIKKVYAMEWLRWVLEKDGKNRVRRIETVTLTSRDLKAELWDLKII